MEQILTNIFAGVYVILMITYIIAVEKGWIEQWISNLGGAKVIAKCGHTTKLEGEFKSGYNSDTKIILRPQVDEEGTVKKCIGCMSKEIKEGK